MPSLSTATSTPTVLPGPTADPAELFARWQDHGDNGAREQLVQRYMPLTRRLARRYGRSSEPFEDLLQVASLGLLKALDRFDGSRGYPFESFAVPTILGEMRRYFRDSGWAVHVPRGAQERALKVRDARDRMSGENGRAPTVNELALYLELDAEEVIDALQAIHAYETVSLDAPRPGGSEDAGSIGDSIGADDEHYELIELDASVRQALAHVPERERLILRMRFLDDLTQTEIAEHIGISQMQVSRLLRRSLDQLRVLTGAREQTR